jgi:hypothetical protein
MQFFSYLNEWLKFSYQEDTSLARNGNERSFQVAAFNNQSAADF